MGWVVVAKQRSTQNTFQFKQLTIKIAPVRSGRVRIESFCCRYYYIGSNSFS